MAATLKMDTLKFAKRLVAAGLDQRAAEAIAEGISEADMSELATKVDLNELRAATKVDLNEFRAATKVDLNELRAATKTDLADVKAELFRFMLVQSIGIVGLTVALVKILP